MHIDGQGRDVSADQCVYVLPGTLQYIEHCGDAVLRFVCIVGPAWQAADNQVLE